MSINEIGRDIEFTDKSSSLTHDTVVKKEVKKKIYIDQMKKEYKAETFRPWKSEMAVRDYNNFRQ